MAENRGALSNRRWRRIITDPEGKSEATVRLWPGVKTRISRKRPTTAPTREGQQKVEVLGGLCAGAGGLGRLRGGFQSEPESTSKNHVFLGSPSGPPLDSAHRVGLVGGLEEGSEVLLVTPDPQGCNSKMLPILSGLLPNPTKPHPSYPQVHMHSAPSDARGKVSRSSRCDLSLVTTDRGDQKGQSRSVTPASDSDSPQNSIRMYDAAFAVAGGEPNLSMCDWSPEPCKTGVP